MHTRSSPGRSLALTILLTAGTASASSTPDILASAGLGDDLGGDPIALDLAADGTAWLLARDPQGQGRVVRLDPLGAATGPAHALSFDADDLAVDRRTGDVAVVGAAELALHDPGLARRWQRPLPPRRDGEPARRVALGELGTVAALAADELHIFSADGRVLGRVATGGLARDLAVVDAAGVVVVTGSARRTVCDRPLDVATLAAFALDGAPRWRAHEGARDDACEREAPASARGVAVARGGDGHVYALAEVEGANNQFRGPPDQPAAVVAFDAYTSPEAGQAALYAYYARYTADGEHVLGQYFALPDAGSVVRPRAIAADVHGNVHLTGVTSHSLGAAGEQVHTERLAADAGFYQVVAPDLEGRRVWHALEADDAATDLTALAISDDRALALLRVAAPAGRPDAGPLPVGPSLLEWSGAHGPAEAEKHPDPETQGTFGYESGVSGSDPSCHCDAQAPTTPALLALGLLALAAPRPRRRG